MLVAGLLWWARPAGVFESGRAGRLCGPGGGVAGDGRAIRAGGFRKLVPVHKKLSPEWVQSLFARGTRTVHRGPDLEKIGMPVSGICTGQLYLGGDGRLWQWDIFNQHMGTGDGHYAHPPKPSRLWSRALRSGSPRAEQSRSAVWTTPGLPTSPLTVNTPSALLNTSDEAAPVTVSLEAFSPFIPLNPEDSNLPATVLQFTVKNKSHGNLECDLAGWLENAVCLQSAKVGLGRRSNHIHQKPELTFLECRAEPAPGTAPGAGGVPLEKQADFGTMGLALLDPGKEDLMSVSIPDGKRPDAIFGKRGLATEPLDNKPFGQRLFGGLGRKLTLSAGQGGGKSPLSLPGISRT